MLKPHDFYAELQWLKVPGIKLSQIRFLCSLFGLKVVIPDKVRSCACGRFRELHRIINLQLGGFVPSSFGRCPEVERVATKVFATTSENQDAVGGIREPGRGCPVKEPPGFSS
jgi:hypothetical protein